MGYRKKSRNRSQKNLVPKKNIGTSLEIFQIICVDLGPGLVPFPGFLHFFGWYRNRSRKNLVPKKVSESVSKKFGTEKKSRNRSRSDFGSRHTLVSIDLTDVTLVSDDAFRRLGTWVPHDHLS